MLLKNTPEENYNSLRIEQEKLLFLQLWLRDLKKREFFTPYLFV